MRRNIRCLRDVKYEMTDMLFKRFGRTQTLIFLGLRGLVKRQLSPAVLSGQKNFRKRNIDQFWLTRDFWFRLFTRCLREGSSSRRGHTWGSPFWPRIVLMWGP